MEARLGYNPALKIQICMIQTEVYRPKHVYPLSAPPQPLI